MSNLFELSKHDYSDGGLLLLLCNYLNKLKVKKIKI